MSNEISCTNRQLPDEIVIEYIDIFKEFPYLIINTLTGWSITKKHPELINKLREIKDGEK